MSDAAIAQPPLVREAPPLARLEQVKRPEFVRIISIYPIERRFEMMLSNVIDTPYGQTVVSGQKKFILPKAERGQWTHLDVWDDVKFIPDYNKVGPNQPNPPSKFEQILAGDLANSLVGKWSAAPSFPGGPGIGALPPGDITPTQDFLNSLYQRQSEFARAWIAKANDLERTGKLTHINELPRILAEWLYGTGAQKLTWFQKPEFRPMKKALCCGRDILTEATSCEHCKTDLVVRYVSLGVIPDDDPVVANAVRRVIEAKSTSADEVEDLKRQLAKAKQELNDKRKA